MPNDAESVRTRETVVLELAVLRDLLEISNPDTGGSAAAGHRHSCPAHSGTDQALGTGPA